MSCNGQWTTAVLTGPGSINGLYCGLEMDKMEILDQFSNMWTTCILLHVYVYSCMNSLYFVPESFVVFDK